MGLSVQHEMPSKAEKRKMHRVLPIGYEYINTVEHEYHKLPFFFFT